VGSMNESDVLTGIAFIAVGIGIVSVLVLLTVYILCGVGLYKLAKTEGIENPWLGFVPIGNIYIFGELLSERLKGKGGVKLLIAYGVLFVLSLIAGVIDGVIGAVSDMHIGFLGVIMQIVTLVACFVMYHWFFEKYSKNAILMTVFNVLTFGFLGAISPFIFRNRVVKTIEVV
jgi:hypothetical protein